MDAARRRAGDEGVNLYEALIAARYRWIDAVVTDVREGAATVRRTWTDRIDGVLTHRVYGMAAFAAVMALLFEALFSWSEPFIGAIESAAGWLQSGVAALLPAGALADLMVDGVIAGVGNVVVFVPQIAMLSFFIAVLEDAGYLARVAFVIDRVMGRIGLHGKAFVPMLSGFACAIPGIMATRTIEGRRDRLITMLTLPMISCSARLPVFVLVTAVVFAGDARVFGLFSAGAIVLLAMYSPLGRRHPRRRGGVAAHGAARAAAAARAGAAAVPHAGVARHAAGHVAPGPQVSDRRRDDHPDDDDHPLGAALLSAQHRDHRALRRRWRASAAASITDPDARAEELARFSTGRKRGERLRYSVAGRVGQLIEPVIEPLGYDWRIGVGILGAFAAREVFVSTLGIVFGIAEADEESLSLRASLQNADLAGRYAADDAAGGRLADGLLRAGLPVHEHHRRRAPGIGHLALADLHVRLHVGAGVYGASLVVYQTGTLLGWGDMSDLAGPGGRRHRRLGGGVALPAHARHADGAAADQGQSRWGRGRVPRLRRLRGRGNSAAARRRTALAPAFLTSVRREGVEAPGWWVARTERRCRRSRNYVEAA